MVRSREVQDEERWQKLLIASGRGLVVIDRESGEARLGPVQLHSVKFLLQADSGTSVLAVVVGRDEGKELVAFVGGPDIMTTLLSLGKKLEADALRWRENRPWGG